MAKRNLCYTHHCQEYDKLPDAMRHLAADWRTVKPLECELCQEELRETLAELTEEKEGASEMNDANLIESLIQATYDSGYYSGKNEDGSPHHMAAIKERGRLRDATLKRLDDLRITLVALVADIDRIEVVGDFVALLTGDALRQARALVGAGEGGDE